MNKIKRRNTKQRDIIYEIVASTNTHPTADWIYEQAKRHIPNISLGTVYRNLKILSEEGKILEINDGKISRFDANVSPHHHFKCENCGNLYDIEEGELLHINKEIAKKKGYTVKSSLVVLYGICPKCNSYIS
jgi:Fur family ferric uptake transcriptional regulator/Fur family peroxide stress response transcriptional regulator